MSLIAIGNTHTVLPPTSRNRIVWEIFLRGWRLRWRIPNISLVIGGAGLWYWVKRVALELNRVIRRPPSTYIKQTPTNPTNPINCHYSILLVRIDVEYPPHSYSYFLTADNLHK